VLGKDFTKSSEPGAWWGRRQELGDDGSTRIPGRTGMTARGALLVMEARVRRGAVGKRATAAGAASRQRGQLWAWAIDWDFFWALPGYTQIGHRSRVERGRQSRS
jgi:hypothetical protein